MTHTNHTRLEQTLVLSSLTLLVLTAFAGVSMTAGAADLDHGWAIIAAPGYEDSQHKGEAQNLYAYLIDQGWGDDNIIFLGDGTASYDDGEATIDNFEDAIDFVSLHSSAEDVVLVAVLDHAVEGDDGSYYLRFGDDLDEEMKDTELDQQLDEIEDFSVMIVDIAGPYSGGIGAVVRDDDRLVIADCAEDESYRMSEYTFSEALTDEDGDLDGDGKVAVEEAHAYMMVSMDTQTPQIYDPCAMEDFVIPAF